MCLGTDCFVFPYPLGTNLARTLYWDHVEWNGDGFFSVTEKGFRIYVSRIDGFGVRYDFGLS